MTEKTYRFYKMRKPNESEILDFISNIPATYTNEEKNIIVNDLKQQILWFMKTPKIFRTTGDIFTLVGSPMGEGEEVEELYHDK